MTCGSPRFSSKISFCFAGFCVCVHSLLDAYCQCVFLSESSTLYSRGVCAHICRSVCCCCPMPCMCDSPVSRRGSRSLEKHMCTCCTAPEEVHMSDVAFAMLLEQIQTHWYALKTDIRIFHWLIFHSLL